MQGRYWNIDFARRQNGRKPAKSFIENLDEQAQIKFKLLFKEVANNRVIANRQKFKKLHGYSNTWQFTSGDYRILAYRFHNTYVLTNGFKKDQKRTEQRYIKSALDIEYEDFSRRQKNES